MDEVFHELSGFLCSALSPRIRCRPAQSAKLYSLSKDLAGRNPQSSRNFDSVNIPAVIRPYEYDGDHVVLSDLLILVSPPLMLFDHYIWSFVCSLKPVLCTNYFFFLIYCDRIVTNMHIFAGQQDYTKTPEPDILKLVEGRKNPLYFVMSPIKGAEMGIFFSLFAL